MNEKWKTNPAYTDAPWEIYFCYVLPACRNWDNLGRKKRLKRIRFWRKKGLLLESQFGGPPYLRPRNPEEILEMIESKRAKTYDPAKYQGEVKWVNS